MKDTETRRSSPILSIMPWRVLLVPQIYNLPQIPFLFFSFLFQSTPKGSNRYQFPPQHFYFGTAKAGVLKWPKIAHNRKQ